MRGESVEQGVWRSVEKCGVYKCREVMLSDSQRSWVNTGRRPAHGRQLPQLLQQPTAACPLHHVERKCERTK